MADRRLPQPAPAASHLLPRQLGAFSLVHFPYSVLSTILLPVLGGLYYGRGSLLGDFLGGLAPFLAVLLLMLLYFPLGLLVGRFARWARIPTRRDLGRTVLTLALVAWTWAALVLGLLALSGPLRGAVEPIHGLFLLLVECGVLFLLTTLLLAYPSCLLVLCGLGLTPELGLFPSDVSSLVVMGLWAIPAGGLPPLLFGLGSYLAAHRKRQPPVPETERAETESQETEETESQETERER